MNSDDPRKNVAANGNDSTPEVYHRKDTDSRNDRVRGSEPPICDVSGLGNDQAPKINTMNGSSSAPATVIKDGSNPLVAILYRHSPMTVGRMFKSALRQMGANFISIGGFVGNRVGWPIDRTYDDFIDLPDIIVDPADRRR